VSTLSFIKSFEYSSLYQSARKCDCWEIVIVAHVSKSDNSVCGNPINKANNGWKDLHLKLFDEKGSLFSVQIDELGLSVSSSDVAEVHINYLASLEILVIEVTHHELAFGDLWQKLLLSDLCVLSMAFNHVLLLFLLHISELSQPSLSEISHYLLFFIIPPILVLLFVILMMMLVMNWTTLTRVMELSFLILQLLLNLDSLVTDGLLHDHV
jgi:hypothetical protein